MTENDNHHPNMAEEDAQFAHGSDAGFTLLELLVVLVILVLLATLITPRIIGYIGDSRSKAAKVQIESLSTSLDLYAVDTGVYPTTAQGLAAIVKKPSSVANWRGPYINKADIPLDPWGHAYRYRAPGHKGAFDIFSYGRDDKPGGQGEDADVTN